MDCNYCGKPAKLVMGREIYPYLKRLHGRFYFQCKPCDAYCGTHQATNEPLGTLANKPLRAMRMRCHDRFDKLWKDGTMSRHDAYKWMVEVLNIPAEEAHIGMFDVERCKALLKHFDKEPT